LKAPRNPNTDTWMKTNPKTSFSGGFEMRLFAAVLLSMSIAAMPLLARNAGETGKEDTPAAASSASSVPDKPTAVKPEASASESEMLELRSLVEEQRAELESQRAALKAQQLKMKALEEKLGATPSEPAATPPAITTAIATATPISSAAVTPATPAAEPPQKGNDEVSPLQLKIGSAYITPVGFLDFTGVFRSKVGGSGIGTNFGNIPYLLPNAFQGNLSELRENMQNSRIGFRVDAMVHDAHVIGYMEADFLGNNPGNVAVTSNSNTLRSRLYWVDVRRGSWEMLGGQTWSLITPGRNGISPLPGDLFYSQDIDVNYQAGLFWGRIPELRFVYHLPSDKAAFAVALDSPEQYIGGSGGGGTISLPSGLTSILGAPGATNAQFNSGSTTLNVPNLSPDIIAKLAIEPTKKFHLEIGGIERQFKDYVLISGAGQTNVKTGGGGFFNANVELFKGFRVLTNNFIGDGIGRYIFGLAPDVIVRPDGTISPIKAGSTVSGIEFTHKNSFIYAYYGGVYIEPNFSIDTTSSAPTKPLIGYGYVGSSNSQNRAIQEETIGFNQTLWKDAKYGALNFMGQYSYLARNPWAVSTGGEDAHLNMVFLNLRYTLPGSAPTLGK
jgi:hypothetical protein